MVRRDRRIYDLAFAAMLICLTVFKWNDLGLPYFWDELGVYTQAADYQVQHTISLAPASVPPVLSRGHPLLFTFINAAVWRVFGEQVMVAHMFCFSISLFFLLVVYLKISKYFNPVAGITCAGICIMQPLFLAQSGMVLPEMAMGLFIFMALCSFYEGRLLLFGLFASLAMLTKESAVVLPAVVIFYSVVKWMALKEKPQALKLSGLVLTAMPYLIFGGFLLLQKWQNGWYFFPFHLDAVVFDIKFFVQQFEHFARFVFIQQGRFVLTILSIISLVILLVTRKTNILGGGFLLLLVLFGVIFLALNSVFGVYMGRYAMVVMLAFCIVAGTALNSVLKNGLFTGLILLALLAVSCRYQQGEGFNYDEDLGYRHQVHVLQQGVDEVIKTTKPGDKLYGNFPGYFALSFSNSGYLHGATIKPGQMCDHDYDYYLLCNPPNTGFETDSSKYIVTLLKSFDDGYAHTALYRIGKK